jgi:hypothetical protein
MYNAKQAKIQVQEKNLRDNNVGPKADDEQPITEKSLERSGSPIKTTEAELEENTKKESKILEKVLNSSDKWRTADDDLLVPPINTLVAGLEKERRESLKTDKSSHWSQKEKDQNGSLPDWPKNAPQHDKIVLNNDPRRFEGKEPKPLVGGITTAHVDRLVQAIKSGETLEHDAAIIAILKEADAEQRELTPVEQKAVSDLKLARTRAILQK